MAVVNYHDTYGHYPPAYLADTKGRPMHSWRVLILPQIEEEPRYRKYDFKEPWDGPNNRRLAEPMPVIYATERNHEPGLTTTDYVVVVGAETAFPPDEIVSASEVTDGLSNTIMVTENRGAGIHWMEPRDLSFADMDFTINSPTGISSKYEYPAAVMFDGSVHRLSQDLSPETLKALLTIRGGELLAASAKGGWELLPDGRDRPLAKPNITPPAT